MGVPVRSLINKYRDQNLNGHQVVDLDGDRIVHDLSCWYLVAAPRINGLVILDVDHKLHLLKRDKSKPLGNPPVITSTRRGRRKVCVQSP